MSHASSQEKNLTTNHTSTNEWWKDNEWKESTSVISTLHPNTKQSSNDDAHHYVQPSIPFPIIKRPIEPYVGFELVFVDPLDVSVRYWWPAMVVPPEQIDRFMRLPNPGPDECLVRYFEDNKFSMVKMKDIVPFTLDSEPYLYFSRNYPEFLEDTGVRKALRYLRTGILPRRFAWKGWRDMREGGRHLLPYGCAYRIAQLAHIDETNPSGSDHEEEQSSSTGTRRKLTETSSSSDETVSKRTRTDEENESTTTTTTSSSSSSSSSKKPSDIPTSSSGKEKDIWDYIHVDENGRIRTVEEREELYRVGFLRLAELQSEYRQLKKATRELARELFGRHETNGAITRSRRRKLVM